MTDTSAIQFTVLGTPRGQPRARGVHGRHVSVVDPKIQAWRTAVERAARQALDAVGRQPWMADAVRVDIVASFATPKAERWGGLHTAKPDKDNVEKLVLDAMERAGLLPKGDQRVSVGETRKVWAETGSLVVVMRPGEPRRTAQAAADSAAPAWLTA